MNKPYEGFEFNKAFGQNFIRDKNLLNAIAADSGICFTDNVLEVGSGAGALTEVLEARAKKVVSFEIDKKLTEFLAEKFAETKTVQIVMADALKTPMADIEKLFFGEEFCVVANLPYYITTPLIFKFLEETDKIKSITVMVQKEVAQKAVAKVGNAQYGITSAILQYYFDCKICRTVSKKMFNPVPKVDSAILHLVRKKGVEFDKEFSDFVRACFAMKRKTLINNLTQKGFEKDAAKFVFEQMKLLLSVRAEELDFDKFRELYLKLVKKC